MVGLLVAGTQRGAALLMFAALLVACSGADAEPPTTAPPTTLPRTTTTTTTAPPPEAPTTTAATTTTTTVDQLARPEKLVSNFDRESVDDFDTTGDDLYRVVVEHQDLFNFLEGNPDGSAEDMVALLFERTYPLWDVLIADFEVLARNPGWRYVDPGVRLIGIEILSLSGGRAEVRVADERGPQLIADSDGEIVGRLDGWEALIGDVTMIRGSDGRWRFADLTPTRSPSAAELDQLIPVDWTGR